VLFETLPAYREDFRGAVPYRFQRYILERCKSDAWEAFRGTCPAPPDTDGLAAVTRSLAANKMLMNELRSRMTTLHYTRSGGVEKQGEAKQLIVRIDNERR
jgi:hypothetical protein